MPQFLPAPWPLVILAIFLILFFLPMLKILPRMGYSKWWAIIGIISPLNMIGLWYLAYARWPAAKNSNWQE